MIKLTQSPIKFAFAITLVLVTLIGNSTATSSSEPPKPPSRGTPEGNPTPGTTRPETTCKESNKPLTALVANKGRDYTLSEYPTFWFYVPYAPKDIKTIEFLILDKKERTTIYHASIKLLENPGIIKVKLPSDSKHSLKLNEDYHWYFMLSCEPNNTIEPDLVLDGWVRRVLTSPQLENQLEAVKPNVYIAYIDNDIWQDAVTNLAELHFANTDNSQLSNAWANLLQTLGRKELIQEPLVNSVQLPLEE
jgi:hypothetical protein